jgi:UDP-N-acetyl-D-mannosaminuronate dehydrogenase
VGGHCIPVYPQLYLWGDPSATCIAAARQANEEMPAYAITQIEKRLGSVKDKKVLVLGVSYRDGVKEVAFSGAFELQKQLLLRNATVHFFDPNFSEEELRKHGFTSTEENDSDYEIIIIQTHTPSFRDFITRNFSGKSIQLIYDGRNLLEGENPLDNCELMTLGLNFQEVQLP